MTKTSLLVPQWIWRVPIFVSVLVLATGCFQEVEVPAELTFTGAPTVQLAAPLPNDTYRTGASVNILVRVDNAGEDIGRVALRVNNEIIGEITQPNPNGAAAFTVANSWNPTEPGEYTISVDASRMDGTMSQAATARIQVISNETEPMAEADEQMAMVEPTAIPPTDVPTAEPETQIVLEQNAAADNADAGTNTTQSEAPTAQPTNPPAPTDPPPPTAVPPTSTPDAPQVRVTNGQGVNVRQGPSTGFSVIGSYAENDTAELIAVNPQGTWYKVAYYNNEGWVFGQAVTAIGNVSNLPTDAGPPTPVPTVPPATAIPPTDAPPPSAVDLTITAASTSPFPFECGNASEIIVTIVNVGSETSADTTIVVEDLYNGQVIESITAPVPALAPNESHQAVLYLQVSTYVNEGHTSRIRIDPENRVAETNENNNSDQDDYVLAC